MKTNEILRNNKIAYICAVSVGAAYLLLGVLDEKARKNEIPSIISISIFLFLLILIYLLRINSTFKKYFVFIMSANLIGYLIYAQHGAFDNTYLFFAVVSASLLYADYKLFVSIAIYTILVNFIIIFGFFDKLTVLKQVLILEPTLLLSYFPSLILTAIFASIGIRKIIKHAQLLDDVTESAKIDHLTGIFNRKHLLYVAKNEFEKAIKNRTDISFLMIDVDDFKRINDNYGHSAGDTMLKLTAEKIIGSLRSFDCVGRYGGEEFLAVIPNSSRESVIEIALRILKAINSHTLQVGGAGELRCSVSIGVASLNENTRDLNALIEESDKMLLKAKQAGKNRVEIAN